MLSMCALDDSIPETVILEASEFDDCVPKEA